MRVSGRAIGVMVAVAVACGAPAASGALPTTIRVGGPSGPHESKIALVMSAKSLAGHVFQVLSGGKVVMSGKLKKTRGSPSPWGSAVAADLSAVKTPGSYIVKVGATRSPPWLVTTDPWHALIARLERVYEVNADGNEPNPVFGPSHLHDAMAPIVGGPTGGTGTIDVSGGWRDAGDAIKFTVTNAMSSVILDSVARLDPADAATLNSLSDIGVRFLVKAHPQGSQTFIGQVADGRDHVVLNGTFARNYANDDNGAGLPPYIHQREAYAPAGSGTSGAASAALASAAIRDGTTTAIGSQLLQLAQQWYAQGKAVAAPGPPLGRPGSTFDQPGANGNGDWQGYMALAATLLYRAGAQASYLHDAATYLSQAQPAQGFSIYFGIGALAAADLCGGLGFQPVADPNVRRQACTMLSNVASFASGHAATNAFGWATAFTFGSISDAMAGPAFAAAAARVGVYHGGLALADTARDYLLGRNPWQARFLIGTAPNDAHSPQHSVVIMGDPSKLGNGMVVGGPAPASAISAAGVKLNSCAPKGKQSAYAKYDPTYKGYGGAKIAYEDCQNDFVTSEPGLAYGDAALLLIGELAAAG